MTVGGTKVESKRAFEYLKLIIDDRLNFKEHLKGICNPWSTDEDDVKYFRTKFISEENNFEGCNIVNII